MMKKKKKLYVQQRKRILRKIIGTSEKPRLSVFRSHKHIYAQLINDQLNKTVVSCSTLIPEIKTQIKNFTPLKSSFYVGKALAKKALEKKIITVIFDRGKRPYRGRIQSLAEGVRESGLIF